MDSGSAGILPAVVCILLTTFDNSREAQSTLVSLLPMFPVHTDFAFDLLAPGVLPIPRVSAFWEAG